MPNPLRLEEFESPLEPAEVADAGQLALEEVRLEAFESGYRAGWDDAMTAQSEEQNRLRVDLARNLQALSFTYFEARGHVIRALGPLLREMAGRVMPAIARETLPALVAEALEAHAETAAARAMTLVVNPSNRAAVENAVADSPLPLTLVDEPSLGDGQVYLRFDDTEERIDIDAALAAIASAVADYLSTQDTPDQEFRSHG
jgi:flagellar biosynthesis/type III secretory pathway protein FliH